MRKLTTTMVALTLVTAACAGGEADEASTTTVAPTSTSSTTTTSTSTTTTTTTTTLPPTTTMPTTTTTLELTPEALVAAMTVSFEESRGVFLDALNEEGTIQSVDRFEMFLADENDPLSLLLVLDITSEYRSGEFIVDQAWELTRILAVLWEEDNFFGTFADTWAPNMRLVVSGREYECPAAFMLDLADARAGRSDWEDNC